MAELYAVGVVNGYGDIGINEYNFYTDLSKLKMAIQQFTDKYSNRIKRMTESQWAEFINHTRDYLYVGEYGHLTITVNRYSLNQQQIKTSCIW